MNNRLTIAATALIVAGVLGLSVTGHPEDDIGPAQSAEARELLRIQSEALEREVALQAELARQGVRRARDAEPEGPGR